MFSTAEHESELPWDFLSNEAYVCSEGGAGGPSLKDSVFHVALSREVFAVTH